MAMSLLVPEICPWAEEVQHEIQRFDTKSVRALKNMLAYCQARISQLNDQYHFLEYLSRQEGDLYTLCRIWHRMERTGSNYNRFREKSILIQLELAKRQQMMESLSSQGNRHETR
jgi:hypothetical protein